MSKNSNTNKEILTAYIKHLAEKGYKDATIQNYTNGVKSFFTYLTSNNILISKLTEAELLLYREFLSNKYSNQSINSKIHSVLSLLKFLDHKIDFSKLELNLTKTRKKDITIISEDLFCKLIAPIPNNTIAGLRDILVFKLFYYTGIKIQDLMTININDICDNLILVGGKKIPINPLIIVDLTNYLKLRVDNDPSLLINVNPGKINTASGRLSLRSVENIFKKYTIVFDGTLTINDLRNSHTINLLNNSNRIEILEIHSHAELNHASEFIEIIKF